MSQTIDRYLAGSTAEIIHQEKDTRIVQLQNLKLVKIVTVSVNNFIAQDITHGQNNTLETGLSIEDLDRYLQKLGAPFFKIWAIEDVQEVRPDLTDEQAQSVLSRAFKHHNAEIGVNWDVLRIHADNLYPYP